MCLSVQIPRLLCLQCVHTLPLTCVHALVYSVGLYGFGGVPTGVHLTRCQGLLLAVRRMRVTHCHHVGHFFPDWSVTERKASDC